MKDILKGSLIIFSFKVIGALALFLTHVLISRHYGAQVLGVFNLILALMVVGAIVSRLGLDMYVVRVIPALENKQDQIALFLKEVFKIVLIGGIAVSLLLYLLSEIIDEYIFKSSDASFYLLGLVAITIPFAFFNVLPEIFRGFHEIKLYSFFRNLSQNLGVLVVLGIGIMSAVDFDPIYILYGVISIVTLFLVVTLYGFLKKQNIDLFTPGKYQEKIVAYSYPMFLTSSMMFLMGYVDSFMISYYLDEKQVGIYTACLKLALLVTFVLASINGFVAPKISKAFCKNDFEAIKKIYYQSIKLILVVSVPLFLSLLLFPEYFLGLFGEEFKQAYVVLNIVVITYLVGAVFGPTGAMFNMTNNQKYFSRVILIALIINLVLNLLLIPIYALEGAAIASLVSMAFWNVYSFYQLKKLGLA